MKANTTNELSHAGQCLDIYLNNTREIYDNHTAPTIAQLVDMQRGDNFTMWHVMRGVIEDWDTVDDALQAAARMVRQYDGMQPTAADIKAVTANYMAYIIESAKFELQKNTK